MMGGATKRWFTDGFRREAVALRETSGRMQAEVAADPGIMPTMRRRWQRQGAGEWRPADEPGGEPPVSTMVSPAVLVAEGHRCSRGRVERPMRRHRIRALAGRRFRPCTTDSRHHLPIAPNLLAQRFMACAPNQVRLADITHIATGGGWPYLAAVLDLATCKIVGWAMRDHMRTGSPLATCSRSPCRSSDGDRRARCAPALKPTIERKPFDFDPTAPVPRQIEAALAAIAAGVLSADVGQTIIAALGALADARAVADLESCIVTPEARPI